MEDNQQEINLKRMTSICFCGMDGAGKTFQVNILKDSLHNAEREAVIIHILSEKSTAISKFHDSYALYKFITFIRNLPYTFLGSFLKITTRLINILFDSRMTAAINSKKYKGKIIIYDRYFYDILVILASEFPKIANFILDFSRIIPRPGAVIILDIDPETAIKRKEGLSLEKAKTFSNLYRILADKINCCIINANLKKEDISVNLQRLLKGSALR